MPHVVESLTFTLEEFERLPLWYLKNGPSTLPRQFSFSSDQAEKSLAVRNISQIKSSISEYRGNRDMSSSDEMG